MSCPPPTYWRTVFLCLRKYLADCVQTHEFAHNRPSIYVCGKLVARQSLTIHCSEWLGTAWLRAFHMSWLGYLHMCTCMPRFYIPVTARLIMFKLSVRLGTAWATTALGPCIFRNAWASRLGPGERCEILFSICMKPCIPPRHFKQAATPTRTTSRLIPASRNTARPWAMAPRRPGGIFPNSVTRVVPDLSGRSCQPIRDETPSVTSVLAQQHGARQAIAAVGVMMRWLTTWSETR